MENPSAASRYCYNNIKSAGKDIENGTVPPRTAPKKRGFMQIKEKRLTRPAAASLSYTVTAAIGKAAALLTLPFFTARLGAAAFGRYALYLCYEGLLFSAVSLGLGGAAIYRALERFRGEEDRLLGAALSLSLGTSLLLFPLAALLLRGKLAPLWIAVLLLQVAAKLVFTLYGAKCRYLYRFRPLCAMNLFCDLGAPLIGILLLLLFPLGEGAKILGGAIPAVAVALLSLHSLLRRGRRLFDKEAIRYLLSLQLPLLPHYLSMALMAEVGRLAVERLLGSEALGAYAVAHSVGLALALVTGSLGGAFQPWVLRKAGCGEGVLVADVTERLALFFCTLTLPLALAAPEILSLLAPKAYAQGAIAVPGLSLTVVLSFLATVPILAKLGQKKPLSVSLPSLCAALSSLLLCPLLARSLGLYGCALGVILSYFLFFVLHAATLPKEQKSIVNVKNCFLIVLPFALIGLSTPLLYAHRILRLILFSLYLFAALLQTTVLLPLLLEKRAGGRRRAV